MKKLVQSKEKYTSYHNCPNCKKRKLIFRRWLKNPDVVCGSCEWIFAFVESKTGYLSLVKKAKLPRLILDEDLKISIVYL